MSAHGSLVNACIQLIDARGGFAWKSASGVLPVGKRFVHTGMRGLPDVIGVWPITGELDAGNIDRNSRFVRFGQLIAVECKTGTGRLTRAQISVHAKLRDLGALVLVVRNIKELEQALA